MSLKKDSKFVVGLSAATIVGAGLLYWIGSNGQAKYEEASATFEATKQELSSLEMVNPYPTTENRDAKKKAIKTTKDQLQKLQEAYKPYVVESYKNLSPEEFANRLKTVNQELKEVLEAKKLRVPSGFYCGFESYQSQMANGKATGVLDYELESIRQLIVGLANSGATELVNLHRVRLDEEDQGKPFEAKSGQVAQVLPVEITFTGHESSLRDFLSSLHGMKDRFVVARVVKVLNSHPDTPRVTDVQFEKAAAAVEAEHADSGFVLPGEAAKPKAPEAKAASAESEKVVPGERKLLQVLGKEEVQVFVRLEIMRFLPVKDVP